jgi:C4-type Zn-finger protein
MVWKEAITHHLEVAVSKYSCTKCGMHETSVRTISVRTYVRIGKVKVKVTLEQARKAQGGSRGIALLFI